MAAGLTLAKKNFSRFAEAFDQEVNRQVDEDDLHHIIHSDGALSANDIDMPLARLLESAGPWGQHFPEPVFDGSFEVVQRRIVGERHLKLVLKLPDSDRLIDAIAFNTVDDSWPAKVDNVEIAYKLTINEYRGSSNPQLIIEHIEPISFPEPAIS